METEKPITCFTSFCHKNVEISSFRCRFKPRLQVHARELGVDGHEVGAGQAALEVHQDLTNETTQRNDGTTQRVKQRWKTEEKWEEDELSYKNVGENVGKIGKKQHFWEDEMVFFLHILLEGEEQLFFSGTKMND